MRRPFRRAKEMLQPMEMDAHTCRSLYMMGLLLISLFNVNSLFHYVHVRQCVFIRVRGEEGGGSRGRKEGRKVGRDEERN